VLQYLLLPLLHLILLQKRMLQLQQFCSLRCMLYFSARRYLHLCYCSCFALSSAKSILSCRDIAIGCDGARMVASSERVHCA